MVVAFVFNVPALKVLCGLLSERLSTVRVPPATVSGPMPDILPARTVPLETVIEPAPRSPSLIDPLVTTNCPPTAKTDPVDPMLVASVRSPVSCMTPLITRNELAVPAHTPTNRSRPCTVPLDTAIKPGPIWPIVPELLKVNNPPFTTTCANEFVLVPPETTA